MIPRWLPWVTVPQQVTSLLWYSDLRKAACRTERPLLVQPRCLLTNLFFHTFLMPSVLELSKIARSHHFLACPRHCHSSTQQFTFHQRSLVRNTQASPELDLAASVLQPSGIRRVNGSGGKHPQQGEGCPAGWGLNAMLVIK